VITDENGNQVRASEWIDATPLPKNVKTLPCGCTGHGAMPDFICNEHANYIAANTRDFTRLVWLRLREEHARRPIYEVYSNTDGDFLLRTANEERE